MKKILSAILAIVAVMSVMTSCKKDSSPATLVGTWKIAEYYNVMSDGTKETVPFPGTITYTFSETTVSMSGIDPELDGISFGYTYSGNIISIAENLGTWYVETLSKSELVMYTTEDGASKTYLRLTKI